MLRRRSIVRGGAVSLAAGMLGGWPSRDAPLAADRRVVEVMLEAGRSMVEVAGQSAGLLTYNGSFPGPLIRAAEGDRVRVELVNALDEPTNLHFHGLHVSPGGNADNVFRSVPPGGRALYELLVPSGFGGTFWYHPHSHGRLARQLWAGLAGPLVIDRPGIDDAPGLASAAEQVVVVKDLELEAGRPTAHRTGDWARGKSGGLVLVNGALQPRLEVAKPLVRLRLVNACNARTLRLARGDGRPLHLAAHDGHLLAAPEALAEVVAAPAQRVDLLLPLLRPGERVELLAPFVDFAGRSVFHCHIAEHADAGMMGVVEVSA